MECVESRLKKVILWLIAQYKYWLSGCFLPRCRFYPSCSSYAVEVINNNSLIKAMGLIFIRLLKCRPGGQYGMDLPKITKAKE